jgi:hypothetical protein
VTDLVDRLLAVWDQPPSEDTVEDFRQVYADPVLVNGTPMTCEELVARAAALHRAFDDLRIELVDRFDAPGRCAIVHRGRGRHTGAVSTPLGELAPTGRPFGDNLTIDVLTVVDDRVTEIWVVGDELGRLHQLGAVALVQP